MAAEVFVGDDLAVVPGEEGVAFDALFDEGEAEEA